VLEGQGVAAVGGGADGVFARVVFGDPVDGRFLCSSHLEQPSWRLQHVGGGAVLTPPTSARRTATSLREIRRCHRATSGQVLPVVRESLATGKPPPTLGARSKRMPVPIVFRLVSYDPCERGDRPRALIRDARVVGLIPSNSAAPPGPDTLPAVS